LRPFDYPVATCCDMLDVAGSNLEMVKFLMQHLWILHDVIVVGQVRATMLRPGMRTSSIFKTPQQCCDMLRSNGAIVWPELAKAAIYCVDMLRSFGRS